MSISGIRFKEGLDGASNFGIWKEHVLLSLEEYGLKVLALRVTLRLREDKPSTHQSFWWMLVLYEWRSMDKTQYMNDVQHRTGQEMHREVRATTNFSQ
jgi:hypothetical protein